MKPSQTQIKAQLRKQFIGARMSLKSDQRLDLDGEICQHVLNQFESQLKQNVAAYVACRGEPDLSPALIGLSERGQRIFLPVLTDAGMQFREWKSGSNMQANSYGIAEPAAGALCAATELDAVLMPLVSYDAQGRRLGMGGGYYDRCFSHKNMQPDQQPLLIGIAYSLQEYQQQDSEGLPAEQWDVRMDAIVTEQGWTDFF